MHFEEHLDRQVPLNSPDIEAAYTDISINVTSQIIGETSRVIRQISIFKGAGQDRIPTKVLRPDIEVTVKSSLCSVERFVTENKN